MRWPGCCVKETDPRHVDAAQECGQRIGTAQGIGLPFEGEDFGLVSVQALSARCASDRWYS